MKKQGDKSTGQIENKTPAIGSEAYLKAYEKWQQTAMNLLSYRMRTRTELESRLIEKGAPETVTEDVLKSLMAAGYLNDAMFAESYIRGRQMRLGRWRIEKELMRKGVSPADIDAAYHALSDLDEAIDETEAARRAMKKKLDTLSIDPAAYNDDRNYRMKIQRRLYSFLSGRGFSAESIRRVIDLSEFFDEP